ncbi:MAG: hypothetical protein Q7K26_00515 [bacterium]|nr:hypothetical protein [bacterium]
MQTHLSQRQMHANVQYANVPVTPEQEELARRIALDQAADGGEVTILSLLTAWDTVQDLRNFSSALRKATLPGAYGQMFVNPFQDTVV